MPGLPLSALAALALVTCDNIAAAQAPPGRVMAPLSTNMGGLWRIETAFLPGSVDAGVHLGTLELTDDGGVLAGRVDDWSSGARTQMTGRRDGARVTLLRVDGPPWDGFRATYEGWLDDSGAMHGVYRGDPTSPHGRAGGARWRARRITGPAQVPPPQLAGRFLIELAIASGQPFAGRYSGALEVRVAGTQITGRVGDWSNGARSSFRGVWDGARLVLLRIDEAPWTGFRALFEGAIAEDGSLVGTFYNDPSAPHGNGAAGSWRAGPDRRPAHTGTTW